MSNCHTFSIVGDKFGISITMWSGREKDLVGTEPNKRDCFLWIDERKPMTLSGSRGLQSRGWVALKAVILPSWRLGLPIDGVASLED